MSLHIPTIRLNAPDKAQTVEELRRACTDVGFFYLVDHGIESEFLEQVLEQSKRLFELPLESKKKLCDPVMTRGYTGMEEETLDPKNQRKGDTKEGFYLCDDIAETDPRYNPAKFTGPNQWPSKETCPDMKDPALFQKTMSEYFDRMSSLGLAVTRLIALALGLDEHRFDQDFDQPLAALRLLHYAAEKSAPDDGVFACGAHSDYGMITLLLTDENPGLQIQSTDGEWIDAPPMKNAFVVNLGDMLERWTNGLFRSTLHRVVTKVDGERYSIPFFYEPNFDTVVECLSVCCSEESPPKYPPTTSGEHLLEKYRQTHADFDPVRASEELQ